MRYSAYFSFLFLILTGCAVHNPMSEMLMFHEKEDFYGRKYQSRYSHSLISVTTDFYSEAVINAYAEKVNPTTDHTQYDYTYTPTIMTHAIFMTDKINNFAMSVGLGNNLGIDATAKLYKNLFLTGAISAGPSTQGQVILQRRFSNGNAFGLSLGLTYQRKYQYVAIDGVSCSLCFPSGKFYTNSVGLRAVGLVAPPSSYGSSKFFLYANGSINYDLTMNTFYPQIGFSLGFY